MQEITPFILKILAIALPVLRHRCPLIELFKPEKTTYKEAAIAAASPLYSAAEGTATLAHSSIST